MKSDLDRAGEIVEASHRAEQATGRKRPYTRRKTFRRIVDLETHDEVNLAPEQLADLWNVDIQTVRRWVRAGSLNGFRLGKAIRIKRVDALAYERAQRLRPTG